MVGNERRDSPGRRFPFFPGLPLSRRACTRITALGRHPMQGLTVIGWSSEALALAYMGNALTTPNYVGWLPS